MAALDIWMLDDGTPGHWSMTEGLVRLFSVSREVRPVRVPVDWRWGPSRQLLQRVERLGVRVPAPVFRAAAKVGTPGVSSPSLIVSRGGGTLLANAWLAREFGVPNIFIGTLRGMPERLFRAVVLDREELRRPPYFAMPVSPTRIDPAALAGKVASFPWTGGPPQGATACMLLGGDGSGSFYQNPDWEDIARGMARLHGTQGLRWCVSSSRRTPPEAEARIRELLPPAALHEACWWHAGDRRPCMEAFLGACDTLFCTAESMSMLEECMTAGKATYALEAAAADPPAAFRGFLDRREKGGRLARVPIGEFAAGFDPREPRDWNLLQPGELETAAARLLGTLGL